MTTTESEEHGASPEAIAAADYLLTHVGGDETDPWQAGHNYAMREAARLIHEQYHLLDYGAKMPCPDCGYAENINHGDGRMSCGLPGACGASWSRDQRGIFKTIYDCDAAHHA